MVLEAFLNCMLIPCRRPAACLLRATGLRSSPSVCCQTAGAKIPSLERLQPSGSGTNTLSAQTAGDGALQDTSTEWGAGQRYKMTRHIFILEIVKCIVQRLVINPVNVWKVSTSTADLVLHTDQELLLHQVALIHVLVTVKHLLLKCDLSTAVGQ